MQHLSWFLISVFGQGHVVFDDYSIPDFTAATTVLGIWNPISWKHLLIYNKLCTLFQNVNKNSHTKKKVASAPWTAPHAFNFVFFFVLFLQVSHCLFKNIQYKGWHLICARFKKPLNTGVWQHADLWKGATSCHSERDKCAAPCSSPRTRDLGTLQTACQFITQVTQVRQPSDQMPVSMVVDAVFTEPFCRVKPECTYRNCSDDYEPSPLRRITNALISQSRWCVCCSSALKAESTEIQKE